MISIYLLTPMCAWLIAQAIKYVVLRGYARKKKLDFYHLYRSGGMPSSHTAVAVSLTTVIGVREGSESAIFGLAVIFALIVIYDATNVRYSVGEQAKILSKLLKATPNLSKKIETPHIIRGHTPIEVIGGIIIGVAVGLTVLYLQ